MWRTDFELIARDAGASQMAATESWLKAQGIQFENAIGASLRYGGTADEIAAQYQAVRKVRDALNQAYQRGEDIIDEETGTVIYERSDFTRILGHLDYYLAKVGDAAERYISIKNLVTTAENGAAAPTTEDPVLKRMEAELKALKEQQAALKSVNEQQEKELELQKKLLAVEEAREALAQAKNKRILVYRAGRGMVYEQDYSELEKAQEALATARKSLSDYEMSEGLDPLSKQIAAKENEISERSKYLANQASGGASTAYDVSLPAISGSGVPTPTFKAFKPAQTASTGKTTIFNINDVEVNYDGADLAGLADSISRAATSGGVG